MEKRFGIDHRPMTINKITPQVLGLQKTRTTWYLHAHCLVNASGRNSDMTYMIKLQDSVGLVLSVLAVQQVDDVSFVVATPSTARANRLQSTPTTNTRIRVWSVWAFWPRHHGNHHALLLLYLPKVWTVVLNLRLLFRVPVFSTASRTSHKLHYEF
jgi:hypothetical protein